MRCPPSSGTFEEDFLRRKGSGSNYVPLCQSDPGAQVSHTRGPTLQGNAGLNPEAYNPLWGFEESGPSDTLESSALCYSSSIMPVRLHLKKTSFECPMLELNRRCFFPYTHTCFLAFNSEYDPRSTEYSTSLGSRDERR